MGIDPHTGYPQEQTGRLASKLAELERRLVKLERAPSVFAPSAFQAQMTNLPTPVFGAHTAFGGSGAAVTWAKDFDVAAEFDVATGRLTPKIKGVYALYGVIYWSLLTADLTQVITDIFKNGSLAYRGQIGRSSGTGDQAPSVIAVQASADPTAGDYFQLGYFNGGSTGTPNGNGGVYWGAHLVGRT